MKPLIHAQMSKAKYGGTLEDYLPIHNFIDSSKAHIPDIRHRAILHSSFGCYLTEQVFGVYFINSAGKKVSTRDIAEEHIIQDLGTIPTVQDWIGDLPIESWMGGPQRRTRNLPFAMTEEDAPGAEIDVADIFADGVQNPMADEAAESDDVTSESELEAPPEDDRKPGDKIRRFFEDLEKNHPAEQAATLPGYSVPMIPRRSRNPRPSSELID